MSAPRMMLFDTASMYFRAFYGLPSSLVGSDGRPVNAVRGLLDFIAHFVGEYSPASAVCCWDNSWRPLWRVALVPSYKAHRALAGGAEEVPAELAAQIPWILDVLDSLGIPVVGVDGYEADDVIGTLAAHSSGPCDIVTGDRDLFQTVDDARAVRVLYLARGVANHERIDAAALVARYGITPQLYPVFAVLRGDPSDGLPGVAGVGEKTAARLVNEYQGLEEILAAADSGRLAPRLAERILRSRDYLTAALPVVAVQTDLTVPPSDALRLPRTAADPQRFAALADSLRLGRSAERILAALASSDSDERI